MTTSAESPKRLYKSRNNRIIDGVCGGIAEYFDVDPAIVRIIWVMVTLLGGTGFILYIIGMIIMPVNPDQIKANGAASVAKSPSDKKRFWGVLLILFGALVLVSNFGWFADVHWFSLSWGKIFPVILIMLGVWLIYMQTRKKAVGETPAADDSAFQQSSTPSGTKELRRSVTDRKLFGVCGGIAKYFAVDPTIVRILYVLLVMASFGWGLLLYIVMAIIMPEEKPTVSTP